MKILVQTFFSMAVFAFFLLPAAAEELIRVAVPYMRTPPVIDGHLEPGEWKNAAAVTGAAPEKVAGLEVEGDAVSYRQSVFWLGWDERNLRD